MPLCITCSTPLPHLYTVYSRADDRSLGKGVRLTQCPNCKRFADKYVEHDYVVLFIDLVLIKPQVYRHLLFNRLDTSHTSGSKDKLDPSILRLGLILVLFDVYITWARIERDNSANSSTNAGQSLIAAWPIINQYLFFLTLNLTATLAQHLTIRGLARFWVYRNRRHDMKADNVHASSHLADHGGGNTHSRASSQAASSANPATHLSGHARNTSGDINWNDMTPRPGFATPSAISTALLVSSCTKLFPILLVIWPTASENDGSGSIGPFASRAASYIGWVVLVNNIEALLILLECGYIIATGLALAGIISRYIIESWMFALVGLQRDHSGPVGDVLSLISL